jgi:hypothetical protein
VDFGQKRGDVAQRLTAAARRLGISDVNIERGDAWIVEEGTDPQCATRAGRSHVTDDERSVITRLEAYELRLSELPRAADTLGPATARQLYSDIKKELRAECARMRTIRGLVALSDAERTWYVRPITEAATRLAAPVNATITRQLASAEDARAYVVAAIAAMRSALDSH